MKDAIERNWHEIDGWAAGSAHVPVAEVQALDPALWAEIQARGHSPFYSEQYHVTVQLAYGDQGVVTFSC